MSTLNLFIKKIYEPAYTEGKITVWSVRLIIFTFVITTYHIINKHPIVILDLINVTELLYLLYVIVLMFLSKLGVFSKILQLLKLLIDFIFISIFQYCALIEIGFYSWIHLLFIIPIIYSVFWFKSIFTLIFTTLISCTFLYFNYTFIDFMQMKITKEEVISIIGSNIIMFYLISFGGIFHKRKIQKQKQNEKQLAESLLKNSFDAIIVLSEDGKITDLNERTEELIGNKKEKILGNNVEKYYAPGEAKKIMKKLRESADGTVNNIVTNLCSTNQDYIPILLSAAFLYDRSINLKKYFRKGTKFQSIVYFRDLRAELALKEISNDIRYTKSEKSLLNKICEIVANNLHAETCSILVYKQRNGLLEVVGNFGMSEILDHEKKVEHYDKNQGMTGRVFAGKSLIVNNIDVKNKKPDDFNIKWEYAKQFHDHSRFKKLKHYLGAPIIIQSEVYGVIRVQNKYVSATKLNKNGFSNKDRIQLENISNQVSLLLEKIKHTEWNEFLLKIGIEINEKMDSNVEIFYENILHKLINVMNFKACLLRLIENENFLKIKGCAGFIDNYRDNEEYNIKVNEGISGKVAATDKVQKDKYIQNNNSTLFPDILIKERLQSLLSVPIKGSNKILGVINCYTGTVHDFTNDEIQIMLNFASYLAIAIENRKLCNKAVRWAKTLSKLHDITRNLLSMHDLNELLNNIAQYANDELGSDNVILYEYIEEKDDIKVPPIINGKLKYPEILKKKGTYYKNSLVFKLLKKNEAFYAENALEDWKREGFFKNGCINNEDSFIMREEIKSSAGIPLIINNKHEGLLFINYKNLTFFSPDLKNVIRIFANHAALAIRNAKLFFQKERYVKELSVLNEIGKSVSVLDIKAISELVYLQTLKLIDINNFYICIYDKENNSLNYIYWIHNGEEIDPFTDKISGLTGWIIKTKKSFFINDLDKEKDKLPVKPKILTEPQRSWLGVPMLIRNDIVGIISVQHSDPNMFNEETQRLLETIANQAAIAIENVRHFNKEMKLRKEAEELRRIHNEISSTFKIDEVITKIFKELYEIVDYKKASLQLIQGGYRIVLDGINIDMNAINPYLQRSISDDPLISKIVSEKKPLIIPNTKYNESWFPEKGTEDVLSWIGLPLIYDDEVIALITIDHDNPEYYSEKFEDALIKFANQAAVGFYKAYKFDRAQRHIRSLEIVNDIAKILNTKLNTKELIHAMVEQITNRVNCLNCAFLFPKNDNRKSYLAVEEISGIHSDRMKGYRYYLSNDSPKTPIEWVFKNKECLVLEDANSDPRFRPNIERRKYTRPMIITPVLIGDQIIGVVSSILKEFKWFTESYKLLINLLALHAGIAIKRDLGLELLQNIGNKIIKAHNLDTILKEIVSGAIKLTNTDSGVIYLLNENATGVLANFSPKGFIHPKPRLKNKEGITWQVIRKKKIITITNLDLEKNVNPDLRGKFKSMIAVPLILKNKVAGVLYLNDKNTRNFTDIEKSFLSTLASQAATVIEKTQLIEKQKGSLQRLVGMNELTSNFFHKVGRSMRNMPFNVEFILDELNKDNPDYTIIKKDLLEIKEGADNLIQLSNRIASKIKDLSTKARFLKIVDANEIQKNAIRQIQPLCISKNIKVECFFEKNKLKIETYESLFTEVLVNIMANAIEAMDIEGKLNLVTKRIIYNEIDCALFNISDNGIGIPESDLDKIYNMAYSKYKPDGFGFGLCFTKLVCDATGTIIDISSKLNEGTSFSLYVPLKS